MTWSIILVLLGVILLYLGAEAVVWGSSRAAIALGVRPLLVGLTVVAFGTSCPELAAALAAAYDGQPGLAMGNVVGSNIANIGLILGAAALIRVMHVDRRIFRREILLLIVVSLLFTAMGVDLSLNRLEGVGLLGISILFTAWVARTALRENRDREALPPDLDLEVDSVAADALSMVRYGGATLVGFVLLVAGGKVLVGGAVDLAHRLGVSEAVIGVTVVAFGTSVPELATSIVGAIRGSSDLVIGNVLGSNIYNITLIVGSTAAIFPMTYESSFATRDLPVMLVFTLVLVPLLRTGFRLVRSEGALLMGGYLVYVAVLAATRGAVVF